MRTRPTGLVALTLLLLLVAGLGQAPAASASPSSSKRYIVQTDSTSTTGQAVADVRRAGGRVKHTYARALAGFSATLNSGQIRRLQANPHVRSITLDAPTHASSVQTSPPWGLDRIDQRPTAGDGRYNYDTTGSGVTVFVVDSGIRFTHTQFGGRASSGYDFVDSDTNASDCAGHGTHVSGTIGGSTYGVAKSVKYVSLRVFDCEGSGWVSDTIAALDWVISHKPVGPSVVNYSGGGGAYSQLDDAVERTIRAGVTVVVAAGNEDANACNASPARAVDAITVGATDSSDTRAYFSNYGSYVDLFAPGVGIRSSVNTSDSASEYWDGTSMATPHVTGIVARYLQAHPTATPAQVATAVLSSSTPNVVKDPMGSANRLSYARTLPGNPTSFVIKKSDAAKTGTITWLPPTSSGSSAVTGYRVARDGTDSTGVGRVSTVVSSTARSQTFNNLRPGATYSLWVRAITAVGTGPATLGKITITALPGTAIIKTATAGSSSDTVVSVTGAWAAPISGGAVSSYAVTAINKSTGARKTVTASSSARSTTITGLVLNASYVIQVYAVNASGKGPGSALSNAVTAR
ncbi:MAG: S8 family serine peptidase [Propionibacteriaceae bacterium]|nr:S8 family serine peptidase [Propionibacteriaceae bacterium]